MARQNTRAARPATGRSPVQASKRPDALTFEGGPGHTRDAKSDLFLLGVSFMGGGEDTFYEKADERTARYVELVRQVTLEDPHWTAEFLIWLRRKANMRSAPVIGAAEFVKARLDAGVAEDGEMVQRGLHGLNRIVVERVLGRADEPGELLAYWTRNYGRRIPLSIKKGIGDATRGLYTERSTLKYDQGNRRANAVRFADVVELCHPKPMGTIQDALFRYLIERRQGRDTTIPEALSVLLARREAMGLPREERRVFLRQQGNQGLYRAGITWEALAGWLESEMDAQAWETVIPSMGYMACLRSLRNFDAAGVSDEVAQRVMAKLTDPAEVAASRQFPFRFYAAHREAPGLRWGRALETALDLAVPNVPVLSGRTLVLIDTSASMEHPVSGRSTISRVVAGALFGAVLAHRHERGTVDVVEFASNSGPTKVRPGGSVLKMVREIELSVGRYGQGTEIGDAVAKHYDDHRRVFIISDMQAFPVSDYGLGARISGLVPKDVPIYAFNLGGYATTAISSGDTNRHELGGLTDATFRVIPLVEAGRNAHWPWVQQ